MALGVVGAVVLGGLAGALSAGISFATMSIASGTARYLPVISVMYLGGWSVAVGAIPLALVTLLVVGGAVVASVVVR